MCGPRIVSSSTNLAYGSSHSCHSRRHTAVPMSEISTDVRPGDEGHPTRSLGDNGRSYETTANNVKE